MEDTDDTRQRLRWGPFAKIYKENDTSAFKKRKVVRDDGSIDWMVLRPKFRQLLADLAAGVIDAVIFYDLDRLVRQPRDLEDLIDIVEYVQRPVVGATGGRMNLINDSDLHMARMMCVMALKSSEDTARRVARMHLACAQDGKIQGRIGYGWVRKGPDKRKLLGAEAEVVAGLFENCLSGKTSYAVATEFNQLGIAPPAARQWSSTMINKMLRNPRYCGIVAYDGKHRVDPATTWDGWSRVLFDDDGRPLLGAWEPIVSPKVWPQVQFELQLRRQKSGIPSGTARPAVTGKYLLSGILKCGKCGRSLVGHNSPREQRRTYRCPPSAYGGCSGTSVSATPVEEAVSQGMIAFLDMLMRRPVTEIDQQDPARLKELRAKLDGESTRKLDLIRRWDDGALTEAGLTEEDFFQLLAKVNKKISHYRDAIAIAEGNQQPEPLDQGLLKGWRIGTLHQRRALLKRYLHGIEVLRPVDAKVFNRSSLVKDHLNPRWKLADEIAA